MWNAEDDEDVTRPLPRYRRPQLGCIRYAHSGVIPRVDPLARAPLQARLPREPRAREPLHHMPPFPPVQLTPPASWPDEAAGDAGDAMSPGKRRADRWVLIGGGVAAAAAFAAAFFASGGAAAIGHQGTPRTSTPAVVRQACVVAPGPARAVKK
jgi:hypothetical protein